MGPIHRRRAYGQDKWDGVGWRRRSVFGALRLRPPLSDRTAAEAELALTCAAGAGRIVEIGVFEGGMAAAVGGQLGPDDELILIDPYPPGRLFGLNMSRVVARRAVARAVEAEVRWLRQTSTEAARDWDLPIDFLRIDGVHTLEGVQRDWLDWSPWVPVGGYVSLHSDVVTETAAEGVLGNEIVPWALNHSPGWELAGRADTTAVLRRIS